MMTKSESYIASLGDINLIGSDLDTGATTKGATAYIIGAGAHGRVVLDVLRAEAKWASFQFIDENPDLLGTSINGALVAGNFQYLLQQDPSQFGVLPAIGHPHYRQRLVKRIEESGLNLINAIHPTAVIVSTAQIGKGNMICAGAVINSNAVVECSVIVNTCAIVEHDTVVHDFASLSPGVIAGGRVEVGHSVFIGMNSVILQRVKIGDGTIIGAGSVVHKDVSAGVFACGSPLRVLEKVTDDFDFGRIL
jgi:sugar O-acyltransferase (sialic acid O-acetyltransferase NeuD family)